MHDRVNLATRTTSLHVCPIIARREQPQRGHHALEGHWADVLEAEPLCQPCDLLADDHLAGARPMRVSTRC
jgi:hypothetical protein